MLGKHSSLLKKACPLGRWASGSSSVMGREEALLGYMPGADSRIVCVWEWYSFSNLRSPPEYAFVHSLPTHTWQLVPRSLMPALLFVGNVLGTVRHTSTSTQCPVFHRFLFLKWFYNKMDLPAPTSAVSKGNSRAWFLSVTSKEFCSPLEAGFS